MKALIGTRASVSTVLPNGANRILNATENNDGHVVYVSVRVGLL
jgi:hypothetical protein